MEDVMEHLTMEHKHDNTIEYEYIHTPCPAVLKHDCKWKIQVLEDLDCPYCREYNAIDIIDNDNFWLYVDPIKKELRFTNHDGVGFVSINYCPMCGKRL